MRTEYEKQAQLAIRALTHISKEKSFALKGGTAINFFLRDLPRLSVDIDLAYVKFEPRSEAIANINSLLDKILRSLKADGIKSEITVKAESMRKINCYTDDTQIKIDTNYISRGYAFEPIMKPINPKITGDFEFVEMQLVSVAEIYGGKICAALDRQHPRDLFDIKVLFDNEGLTEEIKNGFIVCLLGDNGAPYELLNPHIKNQREVLRIGFDGMTDIKFTYADHEKALQKLIKTLHKSLTAADKEFLLSFFSLQPKWDLVGIPNLQKLPAVQWKIKNLEKMPKERFEEHLRKTKEAFAL